MQLLSMPQASSWQRKSYTNVSWCGVKMGSLRRAYFFPITQLKLSSNRSLYLDPRSIPVFCLIFFSNFSYLFNIFLTTLCLLTYLIDTAVCFQEYQCRKCKIQSSMHSYHQLSFRTIIPPTKTSSEWLALQEQSSIY